jgi:transposase
MSEQLESSPPSWPGLSHGCPVQLWEITTIGLDLAKNVFQVHGVGAGGEVAVRRPLRRNQVMAYFARLPPCLVGMEACATAHYWGARSPGWVTRYG